MNKYSQYGNCSRNIANVFYVKIRYEKAYTLTAPTNRIGLGFDGPATQQGRLYSFSASVQSASTSTAVNVGVGTTNPSEKLRIQGATASTYAAGVADMCLATGFGGLNASGADATCCQISMGNYGPFIRSALANNSYNDNVRLDLCTSAGSNNPAQVPRLTILAGLSGGYVGIGTTTPSEKLHVNGGIKATSGIYSYNTSFSYYGGNDMWNAGNPTGWAWGGNVFLITFRGPSGQGGNAVRASFIVFHSRWGAGNNNYSSITALTNKWVGVWDISDGGMWFAFNSPSAQDVYINVLVLN
jgi:hypothetical protein